MRTYLEQLARVYRHGYWTENRTGVKTKTLFGLHATYDLRDRFPLLNSKSIHLKSVVHELLWFISGSTNIEYLKKNGVRIWDEWADEHGNIGPMYGKQWRSWSGGEGHTVDQLSELVKGLKENPTSRRHIISAWNVAQLEKMSLAPCHALFQCHVNPTTNELSGQLYQRSADMFLGVPFNIASYSLLVHMLAQVTGYGVGDFHHAIGDAHIYENHMNQVKEQLEVRWPKIESMLEPKLALNKEIDSITDFRFEDIKFEGYKPLSRLPAPVAV